MKTSTRLLSSHEVNFTREARGIQQDALRGRSQVVRLGDLIFFSSVGGDAWMLDPQDGLAVCLAREGELRPIPITETASKFEVQWDAQYRIENEVFAYSDREGRSIGSMIGYPTGEIERLVQLFPASAPADPSPYEVALQRLTTGRNEPCPCGSGKKYKKCCLPSDELIVRQGKASREEMNRSEVLAAAGTDAESLEEETLEEDPGFAPEIEAQLDAAWDEYNSLSSPSTEDMDRLLEKLLVLPAEATAWNDLIHSFARAKHRDLARVFRLISNTVSHTQDAGLGFFYWAAADEFVKAGLKHLLPEVAAGFRKLDVQSYCPDALSRVEEYLLADGFENETLELAEHFLPIERQDEELMPFAVSDRCRLIYELRVGRAIRAGTEDHETIISELRNGIDDEVNAEIAQNAAAILSCQAPASAWTPAQFELVRDDVYENAEAREAAFRLDGALVRVAREAWQLEKQPPGCTLRALGRLLESVHSWRFERQRKGKKSSDNLLDCLRPAGLEARVVAHSRAMLGINVPGALLLLQAHEILAEFALRHGLISSGDAAALQKEVMRLRRLL